MYSSKQAPQSGLFDNSGNAARSTTATSSFTLIRSALLIGFTLLTLAGCNSETGSSSTLSSNTTSVMAGSTENAIEEFTTETQYSALLAGSVETVTINGCDITTEQLAMLDAVNNARSQGRACGSKWYAAAAELTWSCTLMGVAKAHTTDMATHNFFNHAGSDGLMVDSRVNATGYAWRSVGENIAAGQTSVDEAVSDWIDSPGHCANIMNPNFKELGSWRIDTRNADYISYWTQVFANPL